MKVSKFEINNKGVSYTYKTIEHFKEKFPEAELFLIMGDDRYQTFDT
jgi:nicotinate-nucleotide adenylyltransferase